MEQTINYIRDVLRKEGISGMDSINHCIVFILCRMLDKNLCKKTKIDEKYAYENIMKDADGDEIGDQELYEKIYIKGNPKCLIGEMVNKLEFKNIKFKLEGVQNLKNIMKKIEKLDLKQIESKYDIIGTIYEIHLKSGTSNAMRDLGQYYTHRTVINYMIKMCDPRMEKGIVEKIVDPTMGTGGFLTMSIKYLNDKYKNKIDWTKNKESIIGFDIDDNVRNMALLNIFLEMGELCGKTIVKEDTLQRDLRFGDGTILHKAKIILANEPMGLKNIVHASCCERIKELKMRGTKAEPLFLQLFMETLDDGGRCAVVVPDGMLFNESALHHDTRKYMIENFNLKKIVALSDDFFLNTGVKTSIMFFVKEDKKTEEVEFSEIKLKNGDIEEKSIIKVKYKDIVLNKYSLFVNKYNIKKIKKIEGIVYKKLYEICVFLQKSKRSASYGVVEGKYNFYTSSSTVKHCDEADYNDTCIIIGTGGNANIKYDNNFSCSADNFIIKNKDNKLLIKYIYYYFVANMNILEHGFVGSTIKHISKEYIKELEIPMPSLEVQKEIVEKLDVLNNNIERSEKIIEEHKKIIKYYIESKTINEKDKLFGEICDTNSGEYIKNEDFISGIYPVYGGGNISNYINKKNRGNTFIIAKDGVSEKCIRYVDGDFFLNHHGWTLTYKNNNLQKDKYVYYWLLLIEQNIYALAKGSAQKGINRSSFYSLNIKIPSLEKQKEIVEYCDDLSNLMSNIEKQIKNNKELMKQILNSYLEKKIGIKEEKKYTEESESEEEEEFKWNDKILGKIKKYIDNKDKLKEFRKRYEIPKDVFNKKVEVLSVVKKVRKIN